MIEGMGGDHPRGLDDPRLVGVPHRVVTHRRARSLEEAARLRDMDPSRLIKTMVVRRADGDYVFVLVPGDRLIDWAKLRATLGERRLSLADGDEALQVTGYEPGTITPLGSDRPWPVLADTRLAAGEVSLSVGRSGWSVIISGPNLIDLLSAETADVTRPARGA